MSSEAADRTHLSPSLQEIFTAFLEKRELRVMRARSTGAFVDFAELGRVSPGDGEWVATSGRARLYSYAVYRRQYHKDFPPPYNVAAVILEEGPFLIATVDAEPQQLAIDMPLIAAFDEAGRLIFKPVTETGTA